MENPRTHIYKCKLLRALLKQVCPNTWALKIGQMQEYIGTMPKTGTYNEQARVYETCGNNGQKTDIEICVYTCKNAHQST